MTQIRMNVVAASAAVMFVVLGAADLALAQSADRMSRSIAAAKPELDAAAANYAAIPFVRRTIIQSDECFRPTLNPETLGDERVTALRQARDCVVTAISALLDRMIELKSLQYAARYDNAVFAETVRLLATTDTPGAEALSPFVAMLRSAQSVAATESERALLGELTPFAENLQAKFAG